MNRRLSGLFGRSGGRPRFLPYVCVGYPTFTLSLRTARAALDAGADGLELGVPFSDPVADGPTLQKATHAALGRGTKVADVFRLLRALRNAGYHQPLLVMTYLNPIEQMGWSRFASTLKEAGGDGVIVPDLPAEAMGSPMVLLRQHGLGLVPFLSPTSDRARERRADSLAAPFLYYVSVTGVTGARKGLGGELLPRLRALRRRLKTPIVVGFGISTPRQAALVGREAGGVIIASALIDRISRVGARELPGVAGSFCRSVVRALASHRA